MVKLRTKLLSITITSLLLAACGSDDKPNKITTKLPTDVNPPVTETKDTSINSFTVTDANNSLITTGTVQVIAAADAPAAKTMLASNAANTNAPSEIMFSKSATYNIQANGTVKVGDLPAGNYYLLVKTQGSSVITFYRIEEGNTLKVGYINLPILCSESKETCEATDNIVGSLTGVVTVDNKPIQNVQVSLSGGSVTNGAFANAITDADGVFIIPYNVANDEKYLAALKNAVVTVTPTNYEPLTFTTSINSGNTNGLSVAVENKPKTQGIYWKETFEDSSKTASLWQIDNSETKTGWMIHSSDYVVTNNLVGKQVKLAPNDNTQGVVPLPLQANKSLWYGNKQTGNFLGDIIYSNNASFDGGTSKQENSGTLTSPLIDLKNVSTPISLSFKTWWEIESVNPNINGFDVMTVSVAVGDSDYFVPIARLNPLTDPEEQLDNAPLPFTSGGFNQAPKVIQQENISLDDYKGKTIRLRFAFDTNDELYNGFRGWMIDDILITNKVGTFPKYQNSFDDSDY